MTKVTEQELRQQIADLQEKLKLSQEETETERAALIQYVDSVKYGLRNPQLSIGYCYIDALINAFGTGNRVNLEQDCRMTVTQIEEAMQLSAQNLDRYVTSLETSTIRRR